VRKVVAAVLLAGALAGCGVKAENTPEILRSPPAPPTATPSATERPTVTPTPTPTGSATP
jgi:hypothetical protein